MWKKGETKEVSLVSRKEEEGKGQEEVERGWIDGTSFSYLLDSPSNDMLVGVVGLECVGGD